VPVYYLCNRFFAKPYSLVGAAIFAFEPRIIQNSLLGITDPLFIFLIATSLVLFLNSNKKLVYTSFGIVALSTLVRPEGLFLFFSLSIMFFVRYRKDRLVVPKYILMIIIFVLILTPMSLYKIEVTGTDGLSSRVIGTISYHFIPPEENSEEWKKLSEEQKEGIKSEEQIGFAFLLRGLENFPKYIVWNSIPIFVFFLPMGIFLVFKNLNYKKMTMIISSLIMSIPAFYAYSIPLLETRYLYYIYPLFCVISIFTVFSFVKKFRNQDLALVLIILGILSASLVFLEFKKIDYEHEKEIHILAENIASTATGINNDSAEIKYIKTAEIISNWPSLPLVYENKIVTKMSYFSSSGFNSLEKFLENSKEEGLSHLVIDDKSNRPEFLRDVFLHDERYSYLIKEFDSKEYDFEYHVKIYRIDYDNLEF